MIANTAKGILISAMQSAARRGPGPATRPLGILKLDRLGDFVLATGAIRFLAEGLTEAEVTLVVSKTTSQFARAQFPGFRIIELPVVGSGGLKDSAKNLLALRRAAAGERFDRLVCLRYQRNLFDWLAFDAFSAGSRVTVDDGASFLTDLQKRAFRRPPANYISQPSAQDPDYCRELQRHAAVCSSATGRGCSPKDVLPLITASLSAEQGGLVVSPFASRGAQDIRTYPRDLLVQALRQFGGISPERIVLCGSPADEAKLSALAGALRSAGCVRVEVGIFATFQLFCNRVAAARAVLTMDTSTAHVATALDKPTVVILGGGHFGDFGPWHRSNRQRWLNEPMICQGCNWQCVHPEPFCISRISPDRIASALLEVLGIL